MEENKNKVIVHFIVYFERKHVTKWRCLISLLLKLKANFLLKMHYLHKYTAGMTLIYFKKSLYHSNFFYGLFQTYFFNLEDSD